MNILERFVTSFRYELFKDFFYVVGIFFNRAMDGKLWFSREESELNFLDILGP